MGETPLSTRLRGCAPTGRVTQMANGTFVKVCANHVHYGDWILSGPGSHPDKPTFTYEVDYYDALDKPVATTRADR